MYAEPCDQDDRYNPFLSPDIAALATPHGPAAVYVWQRRPSDPTDLCAILYLCEECARAQGWPGPDHVFGPDEVPTVATYDQALTWVETHGTYRTPPVLFVT